MIKSENSFWMTGRLILVFFFKLLIAKAADVADVFECQQKKKRPNLRKTTPKALFTNQKWAIIFLGTVKGLFPSAFYATIFSNS